MEKSKAEIEAERLRRFSSLLLWRASLLEAGENLRLIRIQRADERAQKFWEGQVVDAMTTVWRLQQKCIAFEHDHPLER